MRILLSSISTIILPVDRKNLIGARVREARHKAKPPVTQTELVARLQVLGMMIDQSGVSKIESGRRPVFDTEVIALAKALKVSVMCLLGEDK